jgi:hypothetical protein
MKYLLAEDRPPPIQNFTTFTTLPLLIHKIDISMVLVFAMDTVAADKFL